MESAWIIDLIMKLILTCIPLISQRTYHEPFGTQLGRFNRERDCEVRNHEQNRDELAREEKEN